MRRLIHLAVCLYPRLWRHRYALEFEALLDDVEPGCRQLFDVMKGAFAMQLRTLSAIPVLCALVGAMVGGFVAMRTPALYSSSGLILFRGDLKNPESLGILNARLLPVLGDSNEERAATAIDFQNGISNSGQPLTYLALTYRNRDAIQAQRVTARLVAALTSKEPLPWPTVVIDSPQVSSARTRPNLPATIAKSTVAGLIIGGIVVFGWRLRRRRLNAH